MEPPQEPNQMVVTRAIMKYEKYNGRQKFQFRTMTRLLFEIQELRIQVHRMLEKIRKKERTVFRLTNQRPRR